MEHRPGQTAQLQVGEGGRWTLSKIDVRSPIGANADPVVRLELHHPERGRVTDVASGGGILQAAFAAAAHIVGVSPILEAQDVRTLPDNPGSGLSFEVSIALTVDGALRTGAALGHDLVRASIEAWLSALSADAP